MTYTYNGHPVQLTGNWNQYAPNPLVEVEAETEVFFINGSKPPYPRMAVATCFVSPRDLVEVGDDDGTIWSGNAPEDCTCNGFEYIACPACNQLASEYYGDEIPF